MSALVFYPFFGSIFQTTVRPPSLEEAISEILKDPVKAKIIGDAYHQLFAGPSAELREVEKWAVERWIVSNAKYFGSLAWEPTVEPTSIIYRHLPNLLQLNNAVLAAFMPMRRQLLENAAGRVKIAVLTTDRCGGGHRSPAIAMTRFLERVGHQVTLLDAERACTYGDNSHLSRSSYRMAALREKIEEIGATLLFSCTHHDACVEVQLAFDMLLRQQKLYVVNGDLDLDKTFVEETCRCLGCKDQLTQWTKKVRVLLPTDERDQRCQRFIRDHGRERFEELACTFGLPIRPSFEAIEDPSALLKLREKLGIKEDDQVILIVESLHGNDQLIENAKGLNETRKNYDYPLFVIVVCGYSKSAYQKMESYLQQATKHPQVTFKLIGYCGEEELATFMQVASIYNKHPALPGFVLSKAGPSTAFECLTVGVPMMCVHWGEGAIEYAMRSYINKIGFGQELNTDLAFVSQIIEMLKRKMDVRVSFPDWKENLLTIIRTETLVE